MQLDQQRLGGRNSFRGYNYVHSLGPRPILMSYEVKGLKQREQSLIGVGFGSLTTLPFVILSSLGYLQLTSMLSDSGTQNNGVVLWLISNSP